ncbi:STM3941 family protein [Mucilaginibacter sp. 5C4]|nr:MULTISPECIES: STM3941 family protein [unclassified Mucilaginibacter]MEB0261341.1 STM3941 family protein [Mucilaginibacter sp. 10I4]MEB0278160.1 STM3941 family protein [Mucilaginibacter sp. 10B2]MEB0301394.1 STM3941 family protein [Mucilaginibacter sp. 5C4]WPX23072.1 STM3941 family protein [Mucilaginibacter sp. 5C4]
MAAKNLVVKIADTEDYIKRQSNTLGRRAARMNYRMYGSTVNISTSTLQTTFEDLYEQINVRWKQIGEEIKNS